MKNLVYIILVYVFVALTVDASLLKDRIKIDAVLVTKAELRRHMSATENDRIIPSTRKELKSAYTDLKQPVYLVVRLFPDVPGHYTGELEINVDGYRTTEFLVALHFTRGWVEYFIPLSGIAYKRDPINPKSWDESPVVTAKWMRLLEE